MAARQAWLWTLRIAGLLGVIHETVVTEFERPVLLGIFGSWVVLSDYLDARGRR